MKQRQTNAGRSPGTNMALGSLAGRQRKVKEMISSFIHDPSRNSCSLDTTSKQSKSACNPGNKELFFERVKTFSTTTWAVKPIELSPLHCAQYGWENDDPDHLRCVTCKATIYAGLPDHWDVKSYSNICQSLQANLKIGHDKLCPWPENPCPSSFLSLPSLPKEQWKDFLKEAFEGLLKLGSELPLLNEDILDEMGLAERGVIQELLGIVNHQTNTDEENLFARTAVALALCGWKVSEPLVEDVSICCQTCAQEVGLWNYVKVSEDDSSLLDLKTVSQQEVRDFSKRVTSQCLVSHSLEAISSNVSMQSETSSHMSENGGNNEGLKSQSKTETSAPRELKPELLPADETADSDTEGKRYSITSETSQDGSEFETKTESTLFSPTKHVFTEPHLPGHGHMGLMKELLLATAPGESRNSLAYSESVLSEVGSEFFEKRIEAEKDDLSNDGDTLSEPNAPVPPPPVQQHLMKELLLITAPGEGSPRRSESVFSEIGSLAFDKRVEASSVCSPRATSPTWRERFDDEDRSAILEGKVKRMRFHEPPPRTFNVVDEHRHWCPWIVGSAVVDDGKCTKGKDETPGWKMVLFALLPSENSKKLHQGSPDGAWISVRKILGDSQSPVKSKDIKS